jgi:GAF domain-containing protein
VVVPDVHNFPDHIGCDVASQAEIVVPLISAGNLIGVLDLDSPALSRFDGVDRSGLETLAALLVDRSRVDP